MPTVTRENILEQFSRKLNFALKISILYTRRNTCLIILKDIPTKFQYLKMPTKETIRKFRTLLFM